MVAQDDDAVLLDLRGKMPVAEMPGELDQMRAIASANFEEFLVGRQNLDQFPILAHQQVAIGEEHRVLEIEHDHLAIFQMQQLAAQMAQIVRQLDLGGRMGGWGTGGKIGSDALHDMSVLLRRPCKIAFPDASTNGLFLRSGLLCPVSLHHVVAPALGIEPIISESVPGMMETLSFVHDGAPVHSCVNCRHQQIVAMIVEAGSISRFEVRPSGARQPSRCCNRRGR